MELPMTSNPIHHSGDAIPASKNEALKPQRQAVDKFTRSLVVCLGLVITALVATVAVLGGRLAQSETNLNAALAENAASSASSASIGSASPTSPPTLSPTSPPTQPPGYPVECPIPDYEWVPPEYSNPALFYQECVEIPYTYENQTGPGKFLSGALTIPKGTGPFPLVVLVGGSGPTDMDSQVNSNFEDPSKGKIYTKFMKDIAWGLSSNGVMMLRFNKPAAQSDYFFDPELSELENAQNQFDFNVLYSTVQNDFLDATLIAFDTAWNLTSKKGLLDTSRVYLGGHSFGAQFSPYLCSQRESKLAGCIVLAGTTGTFEAVVPWQFYYLTNFDENIFNYSLACYNYISQPYLVGDGLVLNQWCNTGGDSGNNFYLSQRPFLTAPQYAAQLNISVLVLQGTADYNVPYFYVNDTSYVATLPAGQQVNLRYPFHTFLSAGGWNETFHGSKRVVLKVYEDLCHEFWKAEPLSIYGLSQPEFEFNKLRHVNESVIDDMVNHIKSVTKGAPFV